MTGVRYKLRKLVQRSCPPLRDAATQQREAGG